jgi:hypothetical protein
VAFQELRVGRTTPDGDDATTGTGVGTDGKGTRLDKGTTTGCVDTKGTTEGTTGTRLGATRGLAVGPETGVIRGLEPRVGGGVELDSAIGLEPVGAGRRTAAGLTIGGVLLVCCCTAATGIVFGIVLGYGAFGDFPRETRLKLRSSTRMSYMSGRDDGSSNQHCRINLVIGDGTSTSGIGRRCPMEISA